MVPTSCCTPKAAGTSCCTPAAPKSQLHTQLAALLKQYNINDYAASVKVFAIKA